MIINGFIKMKINNYSKLTIKNGETIGAENGIKEEITIYDIPSNRDNFRSLMNGSLYVEISGRTIDGEDITITITASSKITLLEVQKAPLCRLDITKVKDELKKEFKFMENK